MVSEGFCGALVPIFSSSAFFGVPLLLPGFPLIYWFRIYIYWFHLLVGYPA
ncbi:hypothetical protein LguiB_024708 [Lonicera macranthoides]